MSLKRSERLTYGTLIVVIALGTGLMSCAKKPADTTEQVSTSPEPTPDTPEPEPETDPGPTYVTKHYLYVAAGACYSGNGNTTFTATTASNVVFKWDLDSGNYHVVADYNNAAAGTTPVGISEMGSNHIAVLIENGTSTGARRIEKIAKADGAASTYYSYMSNNGNNVFSGILRAFDYLATEGSFLISRSTAVEKVNSTPNRSLYAGNAWVNAPAGACASTATAITDISRTAQGHVIYTHANTAQNKVIITSKDGASAAGGCLAGQAAPNAASFPTSVVYEPTANQVLVSYAGNTTATDINSIYAYDLTETASTASLAGATRAYQDVNFVYGVSAMAYDKVNKNLYVATANSTATAVAGYNVEKFSYDSTTKALTKVGNPPLIPHFWATKCIAGMVYSEEQEEAP